MLKSEKHIKNLNCSDEVVGIREDRALQTVSQLNLSNISINPDQCYGRSGFSFLNLIPKAVGERTDKDQDDRGRDEPVRGCRKAGEIQRPSPFIFCRASKNTVRWWRLRSLELISGAPEVTPFSISQAHLNFCRTSKNKEVCHATAGESPAINFAHPASQSTSAGDLETGDKVVDRQHRKTTYGTTNEPVGFDSLKRGLAYAGMGNQSPYSTVGRSIASHHLWCGAIFMGEI
jgi:hypothetical protein